MNNLIKTLDLDDFINNGLLKETFVEELKTILKPPDFFSSKTIIFRKSFFTELKAASKSFL